MSTNTATWITFGIALAFILASILLGLALIRDDLEAANHEIELDELWSDE